MGCKATAVSILFTDDPEIAILNTSYRKKPKPTDVLSFPVVANRKKRLGAPHLGDIVISLETARRQSRRFQTTFSNEVLRLLTHGLLHLVGYEHEQVSAKEAKSMRRKEEALLSIAKGDWRR